MMKIENERLELSDELSRHIFSSEPENGLKLIRDLPDLTAKAREIACCSKDRMKRFFL